MRRRHCGQVFVPEHLRDFAALKGNRHGHRDYMVALALCDGRYEAGLRTQMSGSPVPRVVM